MWDSRIWLYCSDNFCCSSQYVIYYSFVLFWTIISRFSGMLTLLALASVVFMLLNDHSFFVYNWYLLVRICHHCLNTTQGSISTLIWAFFCWDFHEHHLAFQDLKQVPISSKLGCFLLGRMFF